MTEETAKKASELLAKKSKLTESLGKLTDPDNSINSISYIDNRLRMFGDYGTININFCKDDLHAFLLRKLKLEIALVDDQLEALNCV